MPDRPWKSLRQHAVDAEHHDASPDVLDAIRSARESIGKYGMQIPTEQWFVRRSTIDKVRQAGATATPMGLGLFHIEGDFLSMPDEWLAIAIPDDLWDDRLPELPNI